MGRNGGRQWGNSVAAYGEVLTAAVSLGLRPITDPGIRCSVDVDAAAGFYGAE